MAETSAPGAGGGVGLRAFTRGTWLLLGVQLVLAVAMIAATFFAQNRLNTINRQVKEAQARAEQLTKAESAARTAADQLVAQRDAYLEASPILQNGYRALIERRGEDAKRLLAQSVSMNGQDIFARALLAQAYAEFGDPKEAVVRYAEAQAAAEAQGRFLEPADLVRNVQVLARVGRCAEAPALVAKAPEADKPAFLDAARPAGLARLCPALAPALQVDAAAAEAAAETWSVARVFLQINDEADRPRAEALRTALRAKGFEAPGIERVDAANYPRAGEVRYYYAGQKEAVEGFVGQLSALVAESGDADLAAWMAKPMRARGLVRANGVPIYEGMPRDQVEVWLPVAPAAAAPKP